MCHTTWATEAEYHIGSGALAQKVLCGEARTLAVVQPVAPQAIVQGFAAVAPAGHINDCSAQLSLLMDPDIK